jgi:predicted metal-dependent hydrolase
MGDLPAQYLRGIELFNAGRFFESHEALEEIWMKSEGAERELLHALIQSAAALHHLQRGNLKGASGVYRRARSKLTSLPRNILLLDTRDFAERLERFFDAVLNRQNPIPSLPTIRLQDEQ